MQLAFLPPHSRCSLRTGRIASSCMSPRIERVSPLPWNGGSQAEAEQVPEPPDPHQTTTPQSSSSQRPEERLCPVSFIRMEVSEP
ncbi:hypothetical protein U9M48_035066 [Paspalum notatum var. saurae]|uniref:Uncharacterized protein n=1 Tax=Paspalum notatum var. saurae TaxID=547442 RepID=A0AAQ3X7C4_PASNO